MPMEIDQTKVTVDEPKLTVIKGAKPTLDTRNTESTANDKVSLVCLYDGVLNDNGHTSVYVGGKRRMRSVNRNITYEELVEKMYEVTNLTREETVLTLKYSCPIGQQSLAIDIENEEDVREMFIGFTNVHQHIIVYISKSINIEENREGHRSIQKNGGSPSESHGVGIKFVAQERNKADIDPAILHRESRLPNDPKQDNPNFDGHVEDIVSSTSSIRRERCLFPSHSGEVDRQLRAPIPTTAPSSLNSQFDWDGYNSMNDLPGGNTNDKNDVSKGGIASDLDSDVNEERFDDNHASEKDVLRDDMVNRLRRDVSMDVGKVYASKGDFLNALREFAVVKKFEFQPVTTCAIKVAAKCSVDSCPWRIHASKVRGDTSLKIKSHTTEHTCGALERGRNHRQATSRWIASCVKVLLKKRPDYNPNKIISYIEEQYGVVVSYRKAWIAKEMAMRDIMGGLEYRYKVLPGHCEELKQVDPDLKTELVRENRLNTEVVKPPHAPFHSDCPRKIRIRSAREKNITYKCATCKRKGHNRRTCVPPPTKKTKADDEPPNPEKQQE